MEMDFAIILPTLASATIIFTVQVKKKMICFMVLFVVAKESCALCFVWYLFTFFLPCSPSFPSDCQQRRCPRGVAWYDFATATNVAHKTLIECSNMGSCDKRTGLCVCRDGFYGGACQYARCPRGKTGNSLKECSGHGRCLTMAEAAKEQNHVTLFNSFTYSHWDAHKIQGCICDPGYTSGDCSLRTCPKGDDPGSTGQANEVQLIQCLATSGSFTVTFRGRTTAAINYNANLAAFDAALEALNRSCKLRPLSTEARPCVMAMV